MNESPVIVKEYNGMRLNVELGSPIGIHVENFEQTFKGSLVGLEPQEYLLVKTAIPKEFESGILPGITFHVTYQSLGLEYGFKSNVLDVIEKPYRLTFLTYPKKVKSLETRIRSRVCCYIPASAQLKGNSIKGTITDISTSGCRFMIRLPVNLMPRQVLLIDSIMLTFPVMGIKGIQTFKGTVRNTTIDREKIALGIEFEKLEPHLQTSIDDYIRNVTEITMTGQHRLQDDV
ncbi:MAG: flagellar brake protein [Proteobacteria bacterium]|nr:flagellar brake protein [Pseudomonadota bacterium]